MTHTTTTPLLRIRLVREDAPPFETSSVVHGPQDAASALRRLLEDRDVETVAVLLLDVRHRPLGLHIVSTGTLDSATVHPRDVFKAAILANAACLILAHNHPSGDATPSTADRTLTHRLTEAGKLLGIMVLDHLTIGRDTYVSLKETP